MGDARRLGPMLLMVVGVALVISSFFTVRSVASPMIPVGEVAPTTTTTCTPTVGVVNPCPTTTTSAAPTTTVAPATTTTTAAVSTTRPADPTTTLARRAAAGGTRRAPAAPRQELARTGTPSLRLFVLGVALLLLGSLLLLASRERPGHHRA